MLNWKTSGKSGRVAAARDIFGVFIHPAWVSAQPFTNTNFTDADNTEQRNFTTFEQCIDTGTEPGNKIQTGRYKEIEQ